MARAKEKTFAGAVKTLYGKFLGQPPANDTYAPSIVSDWAFPNDTQLRFRNAADTNDIRALQVDGSDRTLVAGAHAVAARQTIKWSIQDNGSISTQAFWIADQAYRVAGISWIHTTKSSVAGTAYVEKTPSGTAPGSGTALMSDTFDLTAANATTIAGTLSMPLTGDNDDPTIHLAAGDALSVVIAGTITSLAGVEVTVMLAPGGVTHAPAFYTKANADLVQAQYMFTANRPYIVTGVSMRWSTLSSVAALKLTVTKDTGTTAAGGGTSVLSDNTNAGILVTQTANVTYNGTLSATAATLRLAQGDRLALKFSGATLTALVGLVVVVTLQSLSFERKEVSFSLNHIPGQTDFTGWVSGYFWTADRDYEVLDITEVHDVATGAAAKVTVTAENGTTASGSGTVLNTANSSAGFDLNATARTVQFTTLPTIANRYLLSGDRLSVKPSGTLTTGAGVNITVSLAPR